MRGGGILRINDFRYEIGDKVVFDGLVDYPEYNGTVVTIKAYRPLPPNVYCSSGHGYYLEEPIPWGDHYVYEERLRPLPPHNKALHKTSADIRSQF